MEKNGNDQIERAIEEAGKFLLSDKPHFFCRTLTTSALATCNDQTPIVAEAPHIFISERISVEIMSRIQPVPL